MRGRKRTEKRRERERRSGREERERGKRRVREMENVSGVERERDGNVTQNVSGSDFPNRNHRPTERENRERENERERRERGEERETGVEDFCEVNDFVLFVFWNRK